MSLTKRGDNWHFAFMYDGRRYRGSCKTPSRRAAEQIEATVRARVMEGGELPGRLKVPTLDEFSDRFFAWLKALPEDRTPKPPTRRYYQTGWNLLKHTKLAGMRLDRITTDDALTTKVGSSPPNTNNAFRTLSRMLHKAKEWGLLRTTPAIKLVEESGRSQFIEAWMEQKLLAVTTGERLTTKEHVSKVGWEPFRTVLLIRLDTGLRSSETYSMRWENIHWERNVIYNPRGKSKKSERYVPLTERVKQVLLARKGDAIEGWVFPSEKSKSGHITDREVSKQWREAKKLAGLPEAVDLYSARHRFGTDVSEKTSNVMALLDVLGHQKADTSRIYIHPEMQQIRDTINQRNAAVQ